MTSKNEGKTCIFPDFQNTKARFSKETFSSCNLFAKSDNSDDDINERSFLLFENDGTLMNEIHVDINDVAQRNHAHNKNNRKVSFKLLYSYLKILSLTING